MKVREYTSDGEQEAEILAAVITDPVVLARVASRWDGSLFASPTANTVAKLCVDYHGKCRQAPGKGIGTLVRDWAESEKPSEEAISQVERLLAALLAHRNGGKLNQDYLVDLAARYFDRVKLSRLVEQVQADVEAGRTDKGCERVAGFSRVQLGVGAGLKFPQDDALFQTVLSRERKAPLIEYEGALEHFFGDRLGRDCFVAFMAPEKGGKSYWLLDVAYRAMEQRCRVLWVDTGDMTESQVWERFSVRMTCHPFRAEQWPCVVKYPIKLMRPKGEGEAQVQHGKKTFDKALTPKQAMEARRKLYQSIRSEKNFLRISCHPSGTISVPGIRAVIRSWELEGWLPDVCVVDYADLLSPINSKHDRRDQINDSWAALRGLSQELHILVLTATQVKREGYNRLIRLEHTSDDKRKAAHVTGLIGVNATDEERAAGVSRLNWVVRRSGAHDSRKCVTVAGCLGLAQPAVLSC